MSAASPAIVIVWSRGNNFDICDLALLSVYSCTPYMIKLHLQLHRVRAGRRAKAHTQRIHHVGVLEYCATMALCSAECDQTTTTTTCGLPTRAAEAEASTLARRSATCLSYRGQTNCGGDAWPSTMVMVMRHAPHACWRSCPPVGSDGGQSPVVCWMAAARSLISAWNLCEFLHHLHHGCCYHNKLRLHRRWWRRPLPLALMTDQRSDSSAVTCATCPRDACETYWGCRCCRLSLASVGFSPDWWLGCSARCATNCATYSARRVAASAWAHCDGLASRDAYLRPAKPSGGCWDCIRMFCEDDTPARADAPANTPTCGESDFYRCRTRSSSLASWRPFLRVVCCGDFAKTVYLFVYMLAVICARKQINK